MRRATYLSASKLVWWGDLAQGAVEVERAQELNSSSADVMLLSAGAMSHLGRPEQGAAQCDKAYRLNSAPPPWYPAFCYENYFFTKRYRSGRGDEASLRMAAAPEGGLDRCRLPAAAQVEAGATDDAAATIAEWKQKYPQVPVEVYMSDYIAYSRQQEADQLVASLRKARAPMCVPGEKLADLPKVQHLKICDEERAKQVVR